MKQHISVSLDQEFLEALDRTCKRLGTERSDFLCRCSLFVMTRREDVVPPLPRTVDQGAKDYAVARFG
jgi:hypothetical protein